MFFSSGIVRVQRGHPFLFGTVIICKARRRFTRFLSAVTCVPALRLKPVGVSAGTLGSTEVLLSTSGKAGTLSLARATVKKNCCPKSNDLLSNRHRVRVNSCWAYASLRLACVLRKMSVLLTPGDSKKSFRPRRSCYSLPEGI